MTEANILDVLFSGAGTAPTGLDLTMAETWNPADGSAPPAILATFAGGRVFPMPDDSGRVRARVVIDLIRWDGERRAWWPGISTVSQIFRSLGVRQDVTRDVFKSTDGDEIDALASEITPAFDKLASLEAYHVIAFEGTKATAGGRDANVFRVEATRLKPGADLATPETLAAAEKALIERAQLKLGAAAGGGRDDL